MSITKMNLAGNVPSFPIIPTFSGGRYLFISPYYREILRRLSEDIENIKNNKIKKSLNDKEKPFRCEICGKSYVSKHTLYYHMKLHSQKDIYECLECGKKLLSKNDLRFHMITHTGEKPYKCEYCERCFSHPSNLRRHMDIHKNKRFYCLLCGKSYSRKGRLKIHIEEKH